MKTIMIAILSSTLLTASALAASPAHLECTAFPGGYDVESLHVSLDRAGHATAVDYESAQGTVGPFVAADPRVAPNTFEYTEKGLIVRTIITVSKDLRHATVLTVYKKSGAVLSTLELTCR